MTVSNLDILCFSVAVKESPSFKISISNLVKNMLDKFIIFGDIFCEVVENSDGSFLDMKQNEKFLNRIK